MGQYYETVCPKRKETLDKFEHGYGLKLMESSWAGDRISVSTAIPEDFEEIKPDFTENEKETRIYDFVTKEFIEKEN